MQRLYVNIRDVIEVERSENLSEKHGEKRNLDSTTNQNLMNSAKSGGKKKKRRKYVCDMWNVWKN